MKLLSSDSLGNVLSGLVLVLVRGQRSEVRVHGIERMIPFLLK